MAVWRFVVLTTGRASLARFAFTGFKQTGGFLLAESATIEALVAFAERRELFARLNADDARLAFSALTVYGKRHVSLHTGQAMTIRRVDVLAGFTTHLDTSLS